MARPTLININPNEFKHYPFMISCYVLSPKICAPKETKEIYVKGFNMITNKDEAKAMAEHISCDSKSKLNSTTCNSNQKWNNRTCQCECKNYRKCKENYSWNRSTCICENSKYLKSVADNSVTKCDETVIVMNNLSIKKTNTIVTNVTSTASINCYCKKVRDCYILHTVLLVIMLLLIIRPLRIRFFKIDGTIRIYDGTRYLTLFGSEEYEAIYNRIRYLISQKSGITYIFSHYIAKIKVDSYDSLPI